MPARVANAGRPPPDDNVSGDRVAGVDGGNDLRLSWTDTE